MPAKQFLALTPSKTVEMREANDVAKTAALIAAKLAREDRFEILERVARDALKIAAAVHCMRAMKTGKRRTAALARIAEISAHYGATLVDRVQVIEFTFADGVFSSGHLKTFRLKM